MRSSQRLFFAPAKSLEIVARREIMLKRLFLHYIAEEARPMVHLAMPLVFAELGWMTMGIVDTMMVGRQANSAVAIGAVTAAAYSLVIVAAWALPETRGRVLLATL